MPETKTEGQKLKEKLLTERKNGWSELSDSQKKTVLKFAIWKKKLKKSRFLPRFWRFYNIK